MWLETRNEDSKDRTNLTSQDVAIIKRKGWKLEGGKILSKNGKDIFQKCQLDQVLCQRFIAHKGRDKMDKYIKRNYESVVSQEVIQLYVSLCSIHKEQKSITSRQKQPVLAPIQAREFLTHFQMDLMDLRNLPCTYLCHRKHNWILHMIDHFAKYSEEEEEPKRACYSLTKSTKEIRTPQHGKARNTQRKYNNKMTTSKPNTISFEINNFVKIKKSITTKHTSW